MWFAVALAVASAGEPPLQPLVRALAPPGRFAVLVVSLDRGDTLAALDADRPLPPASTAKLLTAALAWELLGPEFRFLTAVVSDPPGPDGAVRRLVLYGGGDPTLRRDDLQALAAAAHAAGLRRVTEAVLVDATAWDPFDPPPGWTAHDLRQPYGARVAAINLDGNRRGGRPVADPPGAALELWRVSLRTVGVALPPYGEVRRRPAPGLAPFADATAPAGRTHLWALHASTPLDSLLRAMLRASDNQIAEALWAAVGRWAGGRGHPAATAALARQRLAVWGVPAVGAEIVDGSGLSRRNRCSARTLVHLVAHLERVLGPATLERLLPGPAEPGSTLTWLTDPALRGRVRAKTGTLRGVVALAGLARTRAGERLAFAFLGHDLPNAAVGRRAETALLRALVQFDRN
jgi:D-alanyl-D-alanine carboxypeptidase/D-alanyl-D-alanine-endopeptidase (penicillin-binding protein 4)